MFGTRNLDCEHAVALFTDYLDGALPPRRRAAVDRHLADCPNCGAYLDQLRATVRLVGRARPGDLPDETVEGLLEVFRRVRDEEAGSA